MRAIGDGHNFAALRQCAHSPRTNEQNERMRMNKMSQSCSVVGRAGTNRMLSGDTNKNCFYLGSGSARGGASFRSADAAQV